MVNSIQEVFKKFGNSYIEMYNPSYYKLNIYNQNTMHDLLFKISSQVIIDLCYEYLGIKVGITSILHIWSQKGKYYPHIHMLVTGGGGGSGYIGNSLLFNKYMYCYNCTTSLDISTKIYSTGNVFSSPISNYAKSGDGAAIIT